MIAVDDEVAAAVGVGQGAEDEVRTLACRIQVVGSPERGAGRNSNATVWRRFGGSTRSIFSAASQRSIRSSRTSARVTVRIDDAQAARGERQTGVHDTDERRAAVAQLVDLLAGPPGDPLPGDARALDVWARIMEGNWDNAEPGVLFIDRMTRAHQLLTATKVKKLQRATTAELKAAKKKAP